MGFGGGALFNTNGDIIGVHSGRLINSQERYAVDQPTIQKFLKDHATGNEPAGPNPKPPPPPTDHTPPGGAPPKPPRPSDPPSGGGLTGKPGDNAFLRRDLNKINDRQVKALLPFVQPSTVALSNGCTGVAISPSGTILTVGHCAAQPMRTARHPDGFRYQVRCSLVDSAKDIAVCLPTQKLSKQVPFSKLAGSEAKPGDKIVVVGMPGGYEEFHTSIGSVKRYQPMQGILGGLVHNAWTYWGNSGSPLWNMNGDIIGLHNSWNDATAERHGVRLNELKRFLSTSGVSY